MVSKIQWPNGTSVTLILIMTYEKERCYPNRTTCECHFLVTSLENFGGLFLTMLKFSFLPLKVKIYKSNKKDNEDVLEATV